MFYNKTTVGHMAICSVVYSHLSSNSYLCLFDLQIVYFNMNIVLKNCIPMFSIEDRSNLIEKRCMYCLPWFGG